MGNKSNNVFINPNTNTIKTDELVIEGHLLRWENVTVQISNISSVTAWKVKPPPRWVNLLFSIIFAATGIMLLLADYENNSHHSYYYSSNPEFTIIGQIGIGLLVVGVIYLIIWLVGQGEPQNQEYLNICMNSGIVYSILFKDKEFAQEVLQLFAGIFKDGGNVGDNYYINMLGGKINHIGPTNYEN